MSRRLYRSSTNKVIAGICGGLGEHLDVDPTLMRLIVVVAALASFGAVVVFYLIAWIVLPLPAPGEIVSEPVAGDPFVPKTRSGWRVYLPGMILVVIGIMFLLPEYLPWFEWHDLWPLLLVVLGLMLILRNGRSTGSTTVPPVDRPGTQSGDGGMHP